MFYFCPHMSYFCLHMFYFCSHMLFLVVKAVAEFDVDFAGIVPVEAAEGDAVVEFDAAVGDVYRVE